MVSISSARILPSASKAMRALVWWSRACASDISASARVEAHLTGRFSSIEAHTTVETSTAKWHFSPNPPPTSGEITRSLCSGTWSAYLASQRFR